MEKAAELLTEAELTATQTAERLGYQSVQAFGKVFRGIYGMSPTQYLKAQKQEENA
jgi:AraC-like DNA-binding protein